MSNEETNTILTKELLVQKELLVAKALIFGSVGEAKFDHKKGTIDEEECCQKISKAEQDARSPQERNTGAYHSGDLHASIRTHPLSGSMLINGAA